MAKLEYYWHIHHEVLCEGTTDIEARIRYINGNKKADEIPLRLKLMVKVKNPSKLPKEWMEADAKCNEVNAKWREAYVKWREADAKYLPQIEKLHKKEHPDCPWDGSTIFTLVKT